MFKRPVSLQACDFYDESLGHKVAFAQLPCRRPVPLGEVDIDAKSVEVFLPQDGTWQVRLASEPGLSVTIPDAEQFPVNGFSVGSSERSRGARLAARSLIDPCDDLTIKLISMDLKIRIENLSQTNIGLPRV